MRKGDREIGVPIYPAKVDPIFLQLDACPLASITSHIAQARLEMKTSKHKLLGDTLLDNPCSLYLANAHKQGVAQ